MGVPAQRRRHDAAADGGVDLIEHAPAWRGGVHSPSNADVLTDLALDLVIVVSPMSAAHGLPRTTDGLYRYSRDGP